MTYAATAAAFASNNGAEAGSLASVCDAHQLARVDIYAACMQRASKTPSEATAMMMKQR